MLDQNPIGEYALDMNFDRINVWKNFTSQVELKLNLIRKQSKSMFKDSIQGSQSLVQVFPANVSPGLAGFPVQYNVIFEIQLL